ncbi:hypothetical protein ABPG77_006583 [Micractinium sp. CCAP 211/92]
MRGSIAAVHHCSHSAAAPLLLPSAALSSCGLILLALLLIRAHLIHAYMEIVGQAVAGAPAAPPRPQRSPLAEQAAELLHKRCKIRVKDGRVLVGDFTCVDRQGNIILTNTYEVMMLNGRPHEKLMGQVLVPATHRQTCEFQAANPEHAAALRQLLHSWNQEAAAAAPATTAAQAAAAAEGGGSRDLLTA